MHQPSSSRPVHQRRRSPALRNGAPRKLRYEPLECRLLFAQLPFDDEVILDFLWPAGGSNARTYEQHAQYKDAAIEPIANIDINQDIERRDPQGQVLDAEKFDDDDLGAAAFAGHDGIAIVHSLGAAEEDKGFGHSVEVVAYGVGGYDPQEPNSNRLFSTFYGHLRETFVATGDQVKLGQLIGRIGGSGRANLDEYLPHIHFEFQDSQRNAVSVNSPLQLPDDLGVVEPVRFYKGMLKPGAAHQLSGSTIQYGPERQNSDTRSSVVLAAVRPGQRLPVNMKGFDWHEDVSIRITDDSGSNPFFYRDETGAIQETLKTSAANDEDITEDSSSTTAGFDLAPIFETPGLYYVQALERNRDVGWGTLTDEDGVTRGNDVPAGGTRTVSLVTWNQQVGWAQIDWANAPESYPRGPDADAINLAVVVSPFAPPAGIEAITRADRSAGVPWRILSDGTLVVTGTDAADTIEVALTPEGKWTVKFNGATHQVSAGDFSSVFIDGGDGDDAISLEGLNSNIGASVFGGPGDDSIHGGAATDLLIGGAGDDFIVGGAGEDWLFGGEGHDTLVGHLRNNLADTAGDHVFGESGQDELHVDANDDAFGGMGVGWQHPGDRFDITNDGQVVPLDVLSVINEINSPEYCDSGGRLPPGRPLDAFYYDANGDGFCTPVGDVLPIINFLNNRTTSAEGEVLTSNGASGFGLPLVTLRGQADDTTHEVCETNESSAEASSSDSALRPSCVPDAMTQFVGAERQLSHKPARFRRAARTFDSEPLFEAEDVALHSPVLDERPLTE